MPGPFSIQPVENGLPFGGSNLVVLPVWTLLLGAVGLWYFAGGFRTFQPRSSTRLLR